VDSQERRNGPNVPRYPFTLGPVLKNISTEGMALACNKIPFSVLEKLHWKRVFLHSLRRERGGYVTIEHILLASDCTSPIIFGSIEEHRSEVCR